MYHIGLVPQCSLTPRLAGITIGQRQLKERQGRPSTGLSQGMAFSLELEAKLRMDRLVPGAWKTHRNFSQDLRVPNKS